MIHRSIFVLMALVLISNPVRADEPIEYKLAVIDAGEYIAKDDIKVARFRSLLQQLSEKFVENSQQVADMTVVGQKMLREEGVDERMLNMMEGLNQIFTEQLENQKYSEYVGLYVILRTKGKVLCNQIVSHYLSGEIEYFLHPLRIETAVAVSDIRDDGKLCTVFDLVADILYGGISAAVTFNIEYKCWDRVRCLNYFGTNELARVHVRREGEYGSNPSTRLLSQV